MQKHCEACSHLLTAHYSGGCSVVNCSCTARFGKLPSADELAEKCSDLEAEVQQLKAAATVSAERIAWQNKSIKVEQERAAELRQMLEGQKVRAEAFKQDRDEWTAAAAKLLGKMKVAWRVGALHPGMFAEWMEIEMRRPAPEAKPTFAESVAGEAVLGERNILRAFMKYLAIAAADDDEQALRRLREIMATYQQFKNRDL